MKEADLLQQVRLEASKLGAVIWRNNIGAYKHPKGHYIRYGVCNPGGADLIGIYREKFLAIETKIPGKNPTPEQQLFIDMVNKSGGIAGVVRSIEDLHALLK